MNKTFKKIIIVLGLFAVYSGISMLMTGGVYGFSGHLGELLSFSIMILLAFTFVFFLIKKINNIPLWEKIIFGLLASLIIIWIGVMLYLALTNY